MTSLVQTKEIQALLDRVAGLSQTGGDDRFKQILRRVVSDLYTTIETFDVTPEEFWRFVHFLQNAAPEFGLIAPGLGFDHFLDMRMDAEDEGRGAESGTPRTIEGPLYIAGAPVSHGKARLDDGSDKGEPLIMRGKVTNGDGAPIANAIVDVWHANTLGAYSHFDPNQSPYNNRGRILTGADGAYEFQSIMPSGYAVPSEGSTERLLSQVGRHGRRPAHIHFFVSAPGHRHLTTQINIDGDPDLHDDFAYATRDGLIPPVHKQDDSDKVRQAGLNVPFSEINFDFVLLVAPDATAELRPARPRAEHA
jgi:catechol 1,2-dioxygenase